MLYFACLVLLASACTNTTESATGGYSGTDSEEDTSFSQADLLGLLVSVGFITFVVLACCFNLHLEHKNDPIDVEAPWKRDTTQVGKPNMKDVSEVHQEIFQLLDEDNNGTISHEELEKILDAETADFIFERFDQDNTGTLSIWEIKKLYPTVELAQHALVKLRAGKESKLDWDNTCKAIWEKLDHDQSGTVCLEELEQLWGAEISNFILSRFDSDRSGTLSFAELKKVFPTFKEAYEALDKLAVQEKNDSLDDEEHVC